MLRKLRTDQVALRQKYKSVFPQDTFIHESKADWQNSDEEDLRRPGTLDQITTADCAEKRSSVGGTGLQKYTEPLPPDEYRSSICSVCFVQSNPSKLLVCLDCKVTVHEECYGPDKNIYVFSKEWLPV